VGREFETCLKLILSDCLVGQERAKIVVVGSRPVGLFAAQKLAESGAKITLVERDQPMEDQI
jgi:ribulose 1,5-bisphosphate synthetase/thiazole synthase